MSNYSESGIWKVLDSEYRTILDQFIHAELKGARMPNSCRQFLEELADELTDKIAFSRIEAIERHIESGVVLITETLPHTQWEDLRRIMGRSLRGFYELRKFDIVARQYIDARDKEVENASE